MMINRRRGISVASLAVVGLALAGCGAGGAADSDSSDELTWMAMLHMPTTPEPGGVVESALEEYTGVGLDFQWIPAASASEKLNAAIASDKLADIVTLQQIDSSSIRKALASGQFWDVEKYLHEFPNLSKIDPQIIEAAKLDGHLYGVPIQKPKARYGVVIRQDWLDNLGLEVPHTIEELTKVAHAFAHNDPDGNGKDDTEGIYDRDESFFVGFRILSGYFGAGADFELNDEGEVVASFTTDAYKEAMEWYRGLYEDGSVNQEFVTLQKQHQQDGIAKNAAGIAMAGFIAVPNYMAIGRSVDAETPMEWAMVNDMTYEDVPRRILTDTNGGFGGWFSFPKSNIKNEDELRVALGMIDKLLDEEAFGIMTNGIEGEHYSVDADGVITMLDQAAWERDVQPFASSRPSDTLVTYKSTDPYVNEAAELMAENDDYTITNVAQPLTSETFDSRWTQVEHAAQDAYNQYIVGQIDMDGYEAVVDGLLAGDLGKIQDEFTEAYEAVNG